MFVLRDVRFLGTDDAIPTVSKCRARAVAAASQTVLKTATGHRKPMTSTPQTPDIPRELDTVLVGSTDGCTLPLVEAALSQTAMHILSADSDNNLILELLHRRSCILVLDHSVAPGAMGQLIQEITQIRPEARVVVIAQDRADAEEMNVEVGGCVHHLFIGVPSEAHLREFILSARNMQRLRLRDGHRTGIMAPTGVPA